MFWVLDVYTGRSPLFHVDEDGVRSDVHTRGGHRGGVNDPEVALVTLRFKKEDLTFGISVAEEGAQDRIARDAESCKWDLGIVLPIVLS